MLISPQMPKHGERRNHKLTTDLGIWLFRGDARVSQKLPDPIHSRAWIRLASVLKSETPCNS